MDFWKEIKKLKGRTLHTLAQRKEFDLLDVSETGVVIRPHARNLEHFIPRKEIEGAYNELKSVHQLSAKQIQENHSEFHSAAICAILADLPDISYSLRPITLSYS